MEAREGTQSQLSGLGQWRPERVLSHSWVDWGNGGQRALIYSVMNWGNGGHRGYSNSLTAEWTGAMEATVGTHSQLSEQGQWRPERTIIHSWVNWDNGGQREYSFTAEWTGAPEAREVLVHSCVNWGNGGQRGYPVKVTAEWTGVMEAWEGTHSQLSEPG